MPARFPLVQFCGAGLLAAALVCSSGCIGMLAQIGWVTGANMLPAEFPELREKKVAVVCVSQRSVSGVQGESRLIGTAVEQLLRANVKKIRIIGQDQIADWVDNHNWNEVDFADVGKGVGADMVVGIDLQRYSLTEGKTLFRGNSTYNVKVYDMQHNGDLVFSKTDQTYQFPLHGGRFLDTTQRSKFERQFVTMLSEQIGRLFYEYEFGTDITSESRFLD